MNNSWYLVKYIADVFRNEPTNIGVVVMVDGQVGSRFLGQREDGTINGQRVSKKITGVETYKAWVSFIRREAERGILDKRISMLSRRPGDNYAIERRGSLLGDYTSTNADTLAQQLFEELVSSELQYTTLESRADSVLDSLDLPPGHKIDRDVAYEVTVRDDVRQGIKFDYRYAGNHTTLLDRVSFARHGKPLMQAVHDLLFRIELIERSAGIHDFVALYSAADDSPTVDTQLNLLSKYANTVDLSSETAYEDVSYILGVPVLPGRQRLTS